MGGVYRELFDLQSNRGGAATAEPAFERTL
jgi:hypothetical protein